MHPGLAVIVIIVSGLVGKRNIIIGGVLGIITSLVLYFYFNDFNLKSFSIYLVIAVALSFAVSAVSNILLSGLQGGSHNTGPWFLGGRGGIESGGAGGGIVPTEEEVKARKDNKTKIR